MSRLRIYAEDGTLLEDTSQAIDIQKSLSQIGVGFERWPTRPIAAPDAILATYAPEIDRLKAERGYRSADVIALAPDHPDRATLRTRFLSEHTHAEDEVRFFVEGEGLFTVRENNRVYAMLCTQDDLISVPAGMRHWFDMGPSPHFTAIRLFGNPDGWIARFTGDPIADRFPRHEP